MLQVDKNKLFFLMKYTCPTMLVIVFRNLDGALNECFKFKIVQSCSDRIHSIPFVNTTP